MLSVIMRTCLYIQVYFAQKCCCLINNLVVNTASVQTLLEEIQIDGNPEHSQGEWEKSDFFHNQNFLFPTTLVHQFMNMSNFPNQQKEYN